MSFQLNLNLHPTNPSFLGHVLSLFLFLHPHQHIRLLPRAFEMDEGLKDTHPEIWRGELLHLVKVCPLLMVDLAPVPLFLVGRALLAEVPVYAPPAGKLLPSLDILFPYKLFFQWFQKMSLVPSS